jgi:N4-gp56 family major capsid protein
MANTTGINAELFSNLVTAAQFAAYENSVARQMATIFDAPVNAGKVLQVPVWSSISAENITDESAATAKDTNTSQALITLSEHVVYHQVTDMLKNSAESNVMSQLGEQSGRAIAESMDTQFMSEFSNLGGATTAIALASFGKDDIMDRVAAIRSNKVTGPFFAVIHPTAANAIKKSLTATDAYTANTNVGNDLLSNYFVGNIAGCSIIESSLVPYDSGTGVATCAVFSPSAIGHAMRGSISAQEQYQAANRATDLVLTGVAGAATLQATHGQIMNVDLVA